MPEDPGEGIADVTPTSSVDSEQKSPHLALTDYQRTTEGLLAAYVAVEFGRITGSVDARQAAGYAAQVTDNSRLLAGSSARSHLALLRGQVEWLRGLPVGSGELRW
jgi:hypothetical protein